MNIELLEKVKKHILEEPRRFYMHDWSFKVDPTDPNNPPCGTVACIAGWAVLLSGKASEIVDLESWSPSAASLLGLDSEEASNLFFVSSWPSQFNRGWYELNRDEKVKVAAARIDHLIATGE